MINYQLDWMKKPRGLNQEGLNEEEDMPGGWAAPWHGLQSLQLSIRGPHLLPGPRVCKPAAPAAWGPEADPKANFPIIFPPLAASCRELSGINNKGN